MVVGLVFLKLFGHTGWSCFQSLTFVFVIYHVPAIMLDELLATNDRTVDELSWFWGHHAKGQGHSELSVHWTSSMNHCYQKETGNYKKSILMKHLEPI